MFQVDWPIILVMQMRGAISDHWSVDRWRAVLITVYLWALLLAGALVGAVITRADILSTPKTTESDFSVLGIPLVVARRSGETANVTPGWGLGLMLILLAGVAIALASHLYWRPRSRAAAAVAPVA